MFIKELRIEADSEEAKGKIHRKANAAGVEAADPTNRPESTQQELDEEQQKPKEQGIVYLDRDVCST